LVVLSLLIPGATARYVTAAGDNAGVDRGDTVYIGEQSLNFSEFKSGIKEPVNMVRYESGSIANAIVLTDMIGSINPGAAVGRYYPDYGGGDIDQTISIDVRDPSLGEMKIYAYNTHITPDGLPAHPNEISRNMEAMFYMPMSNIVSSQLKGSWYEYELTGAKGSSKRITNSAGTIINLDKLTLDPSKPDQTLAFRLAQQAVIPTGNSTVSMKFRLKLNGLSTEGVYTFNAASFGAALAVDKNQVQQSDSLTLTLTGEPFTLYTIKLSPASSNGPYFSETSGYTRPSPQEITLYPGWTGSKTAVIEVPVGSPPGEYKIETADPVSGVSKSVSFTVTKSGAIMEFEEPSDDVRSGRFSVGDTILLTGTCKNTNDYVPIYLYMTGPNLPANGVDLRTHTEVVDGDVSSFTVATYDPSLGSWDVAWWTKGLESGTYTVHANLNPYGHVESGYPGGKGNVDGKVPPAWDYPLSEQTFQVKSDDNSGGYFSQGDVLYSWWIARGSPGITSATSFGGEIRWYIFGDNFRYADRQAGFPLYKVSQEKFVDAPWGEYGFTYDRNFTYLLTPGTYYIIYQHPGPNNVFDVVADDGYGKLLTAVSTSYGSSTNIGRLQNKNAADALTRMFADPRCDDLYVMKEFVVEEPWISFDSPGMISVGDTLAISGRTNLAATDESADGTDVGDTLFLAIDRVDLNSGEKSNTAMKIPSTTTTPKSPLSFQGYRTYTFDEIDTSSWYPGVYVASIECKDVKFTETFTFELSAEGSHVNQMTIDPVVDPSLSSTTGPTYTSSPYTTPRDTFTPYPTPTPTQSPGFGVAAVLIGIFCVFFWRKHS